MTTVLLVDDEEITRIGMRAILAQEQKIKIVGEAGNRAEALRLAKTLHPQLVLIDMPMPGIENLEITRQLLLFNPRIKIIIVSTAKEPFYPSRLFEMGIVGYVTKETSSQEIVKALRTVLKGGIYVDPSIAQILALRCVQSESEQLLEKLSLRELQVALMICQAKSVNEIADKLHVSAKTIMSYRCGLFKKLHIHNEVQLILVAKKLGLV